MKPVLIDRSLVNMNFINRKFDDESLDSAEAKKAMFMYVCSLTEAGASYIELDFKSVMRLPKPSGSENYIYRVDSPEEFVVANALKFAYAVVPLEYAYLLPQLELPVILEIDVGESDIFDILRFISANTDLSRFDMLRLVGDFEPGAIPSIISTYKRRSVLPLDLCPKNTKLNALDSAIAAYRSNSDAVTVCFGDHEEFASLEETLIMLAAMHRIVVSGDYLEGICKASLFSAMFRETKKTNLSMMMSKYMYCPLDIENIDAPANTGEEESNLRIPPVRVRDRSVHRSPAARVLYSMGVEQETTDGIMELIGKNNMDICGKRKDGNGCGGYRKDPKDEYLQ